MARLTLWDTVSIIVGIVIGAGIYETVPLILQNVPDGKTGLWLWAAGGVLTLAGAICYSELACAHPNSGGDYHYLTAAYGSWAGFLFGWAQLTVIMSGSIGMMAYVFAEYAARFSNLSPASASVFAAMAVTALTMTNMAGLAAGKRTQNLLTGLKIIGLCAILIAGFFWRTSAVAVVPADVPVVGGGSVGFAMILVLYTYGGWNDAALVTGDMEEPGRNIPRALIIGTLGVAFIYLVVNAAYLSGLGFTGARQSRAIAAEILSGPLGEFGARAMSLLVMISALGAVNGMILTGSRTCVALGEGFSPLSGFARRHGDSGAPVTALLCQAGITLMMIFMAGSTAGKTVLGGVLGSLGLNVPNWEGRSGFETLLRCTAPFFWLLFLMTGASVFILRWRHPERLRPFPAPFDSVAPILFCGTCGYMLYSAAVYAGGLMLLGLAPLAAGMIWFGIVRLKTPGGA
jgi:APA family basic amino acid/polyamine antiporter